jgi:pimeloyl-ACP methyl ester carboxylesterase
MATFVLVHGAWGGSYGWRKVRPLLAAHGHQVFTPSLTGIGERAHLTSPQVDLSLHVQDVVNAIWYEDLREITLVGYSYGGMVVTGAVDYVAERVQHLVYLDAFLPNDGEALQGLVTELPESFPGDWLMPPMQRDFEDRADAEFSAPRRVPHPRGCFSEPVRLRTPLEDRHFSLTYIKATGDPRPASGRAAFWEAADRTRHSPRWRYYEVDTNHMVPFNRPQWLAETLMGVSG